MKWSYLGQNRTAHRYSKEMTRVLPPLFLCLQGRLKWPRWDSHSEVNLCCDHFLVQGCHVWLSGEARSRDRRPIPPASGSVIYLVWWNFPAPFALEREDCVQNSSPQKQSHLGSRREACESSWGPETQADAAIISSAEVNEAD